MCIYIYRERHTHTHTQIYILKDTNLLMVGPPLLLLLTNFIDNNSELLISASIVECGAEVFSGKSTN